MGYELVMVRRMEADTGYTDGWRVQSVAAGDGAYPVPGIVFKKLPKGRYGQFWRGTVAQCKSS